jgi:hypothetical protein
VRLNGATTVWRWPWRALLVTALIALLALLGGCGDDDSNDSEQDVRAAAQSYAAAFAAADYERMCELLSGGVKKALGTGSTTSGQSTECPTQLKVALTQGHPKLRRRVRELREALADYEIASVRIDGDKAVVTDNVRVGSDPGTTTLVNEDGRWVVAFVF